MSTKYFSNCIIINMNATKRFYMYHVYFVRYMILFTGMTQLYVHVHYILTSLLPWVNSVNSFLDIYAWSVCDNSHSSLRLWTNVKQFAPLFTFIQSCGYQVPYLLKIYPTYRIGTSMNYYKLDQCNIHYDDSARFLQ